MIAENRPRLIILKVSSLYTVPKKQLLKQRIPLKHRERAEKKYKNALMHNSYQISFVYLILVERKIYFLINVFFRSPPVILSLLRLVLMFPQTTKAATWRCSIKKVFLKNFEMFPGKCLCWSLEALIPCNFIK